MKKLLLISAVLIFGTSSFAQLQQRSVTSKRLQDISVPLPSTTDGYIAPQQSVNGTVNSKSAMAIDVIGGTRYDAQTNGSLAQRIIVNADGTISAVWTRGMLDAASYSDRGTGYNYFDGTAWQAEPTARIETLRTGWPSIAKWNGNGEILVAHQAATTPLVISTRPVAGTGAWTQSLLNPPAGAPGLIWASIMTNGSNHQNVHLLTLTGPSGNGGAAYQGLDGALLYFRSLDGGTTWDINGVIIPPMTSVNYLAFGADSYAWAAPKGDTIAFVVGDNWTDTFVMKSVDNGTTWTKIPILNNSNKLVPNLTYTPIFACSDGSNAVAIDNNGKIHVVFGRMRASDDGSQGKVYYPYTDGVVYWNEDMPMLDDSLNLDTLDAHGQLLGYVVANTAGDSIMTIPYYGAGMTSYSNITIDENNNIFVVWSGVTVGNPSPEGFNYRHLWTRGSTDGGQSWSNFLDLNEGLFFIYREFVFPFMSKTTFNDKIQMIYQSADVPGSAIQQTTNPVHDNTIEFRDVLKSDIVSTNDHKQNPNKISLNNYPNPFKGITTITMELPQGGNVKIDVTNVSGQVVASIDKGKMNAGIHQVAFDASALAGGVYFYSVKVNGVSYTNRMIVF